MTTVMAQYIIYFCVFLAERIPDGLWLPSEERGKICARPDHQLVAIRKLCSGRSFRWIAGIIVRPRGWDSAEVKSSYVTGYRSLSYCYCFNSISAFFFFFFSILLLSFLTERKGRAERRANELEIMQRICFVSSTLLGRKEKKKRSINTNEKF